MLFADECYSEIYWKEPPVGALEVAGKDFANVVAFNSLSKRSSLPGLRIGFVAGDKRFIKPFLDLRAVSAPQVPVPAQEVAIAAYTDEAHVEENRALYRAKFDLADQIIGNRYGYKRPAGGFFLWLDVSQHGGSEAAAREALERSGPARRARQLRGAPAGRTASIAGEGYIRVAMVQDRETTAEALHRHGEGVGLIMPAIRYTLSLPPTWSRTICAPRCAAACTRSSASACSASPASRRSRSPPGRCRTPRSATPPMRRCATRWASSAPTSADLMMQIARHRDGRAAVSGRRLGLAAAHAPPARAAAHRGAILWVAGTFAAAGFASCLAPSKSWPLPTGLGGVVGDSLLRAPAWVFGGPLSGAPRFVIAIMIGVAAFAALALAAGFGWRREEDDEDEAEEKPAQEEPPKPNVGRRRRRRAPSRAASSRSAGSIISSTA